MHVLGWELLVGWLQTKKTSSCGFRVPKKPFHDVIRVVEMRATMGGCQCIARGTPLERTLVDYI